MDKVRLREWGVLEEKRDGFMVKTTGNIRDPALSVTAILHTARGQETGM